MSRRYLVNDKTALDEITGFASCPAGFSGRVEDLLASVGSTREEREHSVGLDPGLFQDAVVLANELYVPK